MTAEWRHVSGRFSAFIAGLRATPTERRQARAAAAEVARSLRPVFHPGLDFSHTGGTDHVVVGGFAKGTAMDSGPGESPAVDMLYLVPGGYRPRLVHGEGLLAPLFCEVAAALRDTLGGVELAPEGWLRVAPSRRGAAGPRAAVRLIPCSPCPRGGYLVGDSGLAATWRYCHPALERARLREADRISGDKATHLILMLKAWRRTERVPISALALEILVTEFVRIWTYQRRSLLFYDWMLRDFFFWLREQGGRVLAVPGAVEALALGHNWVGRADRAYRLAESAARLERENRNDEAERAWRKLFGPGTPRARRSLAAPPRLARPETAPAAGATSEDLSSGYG